MELKLVTITVLLALALAISGCTMPGASPSPTPTPTPLPTATAAPTLEPTAVPSVTPTSPPEPTPTPTPTPFPVYTNGSPVSVSHIHIDWDTTQYEGQAKQTATMTINNVDKDNLVLDVKVLYKVTTPTTFIDPDGTVHNLTNTITKTANIGVVQWQDQKALTFDVSHAKNVPVTVSVVVQWRGGQAMVFEKTLNMADHSFGTYDF